jgi:hypothetical protein
MTGMLSNKTNTRMERWVSWIPIVVETLEWSDLDASADQLALLKELARPIQSPL